VRGLIRVRGVLSATIDCAAVRRLRDVFSSYDESPIIRAAGARRHPQALRKLDQAIRVARAAPGRLRPRPYKLRRFYPTMPDSDRARLFQGSATATGSMISFTHPRAAGASTGQAAGDEGAPGRRRFGQALRRATARAAAARFRGNRGGRLPRSCFFFARFPQPRV